MAANMAANMAADMATEKSKLPYFPKLGTSKCDFGGK